MLDVAIDGSQDARFQGVRAAFAENFREHGEVGATVAATVGGKLVVDLWAGHADAARTRPWTRDTIVNIASSTKALPAVCAHRLVDRGLLDLAAPVASYWPEFAQAGKAAIPVHMLLSHRAGPMWFVRVTHLARSASGFTVLREDTWIFTTRTVTVWTAPVTFRLDRSLEFPDQG